MTDSDKPLFYLIGRVIHKRPIVTKTETGKTISLGFPVCEVSQWCDEEELLNHFNETAS